MFRIASRTAFRYLKRERRWPEHLRDDAALEELAAPEPAPAPVAIEELLRDGHVTLASRAVLVLHFQEDMTLPEVAAVLDSSTSAPSSRGSPTGLATLRRHHASRRRTP